MCGFIVEFRKKNTFFNKNKFKSSAKFLSQRGPDQNKSLYLDNVSMEFFRLSIRDLSDKGSQPMWDVSKRYAIVFNGEIYNTSDLKKKLNTKLLKGTSDTEILINLYAKYKSKMLEFLEGMFAFVIYDSKNKVCFVVRDKFGIKPLYFQKFKNKIVISSEIKPLLIYNSSYDFNIQTFKNFFFKGYLDHKNNSFFKNIYSIEPGSFLSTNLDSFNFKTYWNIRDLKKPNINKKNQLKNILFKSIKKHLISDREIGLFLSGGTDSSIILHLINKISKYKIKTFTYDFVGSGKLGESTLAEKIAKSYNLKHYKEVIDPKYVINNFDNMITKLESPFTSIRLFGTDKLYRTSKEKNIKVIIEGHGGDEMMGGYGYNKFPYIIDKFYNNDDKIQNILLNSFNNIDIKKFSYEDYVFTLLNQGLSTTDGMPYFYKKIFKKNLIKFIENSPNKKEMKNFIKHGFLRFSQIQDIEYVKIPRVLKYSDRISMSYGTECRVPFLDNQLFEHCFNLKNNDKYLNGISRHVLKNIFNKEKISKYFTIDKKSIVDPQKLWLKTHLKDYLMDNINSKNIFEIGMFEPKEVKKYCEAFLRGKVDSSYLIFTLLTSLRFIDNFKNSKFISN